MASQSQQGQQLAEELTGIDLASTLRNRYGEFIAQVGNVRLYVQATPGHSISAIVPMWSVTQISPATQQQFEETQSSQSTQGQRLGQLQNR